MLPIPIQYYSKSNSTIYYCIKSVPNIHIYSLLGISLGINPGIHLVFLIYNIYSIYYREYFYSPITILNESLLLPHLPVLYSLYILFIYLLGPNIKLVPLSNTTLQLLLHNTILDITILSTHIYQYFLPNTA